MIVTTISRMLLYSGASLLFYIICLRHRSCHRFNRLFILICTVLSMLVPFLMVKFAVIGVSAPAALLLTHLNTLSTDVGEQFEQLPGDNTAIAPGGLFTFLFWIVYTVGLLINLLKLARSLFTIYGYKKRFPYELVDGTRIYLTDLSSAPFSFLNNIFWDRELDRDSTQGRFMLAHELTHVQQQHSADIIFIALLGCIAWLNPFLIFTRKELQSLHEYEADRVAANRQPHLYAELLVSGILDKKFISICHSFSHQHLKRRIMMLTNPMQTGHKLVRKSIAVLLVAITTMAFTVHLTARDQPQSHAAIRSAANTYILVIDAGHGGIDNGAVAADGTREKDLALAIALKLEALAPSYNIKTLLTRNTDVLPMSAATINEGLKNRTELVNRQEQPILLSVHVNFSDASAAVSGIEAYVSNNRKDAGGEKLAGMLLTNLGTIYHSSSEVHQRKTQHIWILDQSKAPAVLIECGNLSNPKDLAFMKDEHNQEAIARKMLETIAGFVAAQ